MPHQLPAGSPFFIARTRELETLTEALNRATGGKGTASIFVVAGAGGIGKTSLALHWAHENIERFPDGQLYVNLRGFDPSGVPVRPSVAMRGLIEALGIHSEEIPIDLNKQSALYRSLMKNKRMLLLLDNARDTAQVIPLLPADTACYVLVTSRRRLTGLMSAYHARVVTLDTLELAEARDLLIGHLGTNRVACEPGATADLLEYCAGLPLALSIVAANASIHPQFPLSCVVDELRDSSGRLEAIELRDSNINLRAVLFWSYDALEPDATAIFRMFGCVPFLEMDLHAIANLVARTPQRAKVLLNHLEAVHLVRQQAPNRYRMHDLVRLFATDRVTHDLEQPVLESAIRRLGSFYLHTAYRGDQYLHSHRQPITLTPLEQDCVPLAFTDIASAMKWFLAEHSCLIAMQRLALERDWDSCAWQLAWVMDSYHRRRNLVSEYLTVSRAGLDAAERDGDVDACAQLQRSLGDAFCRLGEFDIARQHLRTALTLAKQSHNILSQFYTLHVMAWSWELQNIDDQALLCATESLRLAQALNNQLTEADAFRQIGFYQTRLGNLDKGRFFCDSALAIYRRHNDLEHEAHVLHELGYLAHRTGDEARAIDHYRSAIDLFHVRGNSFWEAILLDHLAESYVRTGQSEMSRAAWQKAIELYRIQHRSKEVERVQRRIDAIETDQR